MSELVDRDLTAPEASLPGCPADLRPGLVPETPAQLHPRRNTEPLRRSLTHGRGLAGAVLVGIVVLLGALAPVLAPFAPDEQLDASFLLGPSSTHWLGTDDVNRDALSRVLFALRRRPGDRVRRGARRCDTRITDPRSGGRHPGIHRCRRAARIRRDPRVPGTRSGDRPDRRARARHLGDRAGDRPRRDTRVRQAHTYVCIAGCANFHTSRPPWSRVRAPAGFCASMFCRTRSNHSEFNWHCRCRSPCSSKAR